MVKIALVHVAFLDVKFISTKVSAPSVPSLSIACRVFGRSARLDSDALISCFKTNPSQKETPKWPERLRVEIEFLPSELEVTLHGFKKLNPTGKFDCLGIREARPWVKLYDQGEYIAEIHIELEIEDLEPVDLVNDRHAIPKLAGIQCKIITHQELEIASAYASFWINQLEKYIKVKHIHTVHAVKDYHIQIWYESKVSERKKDSGYVVR